MKILLLSLMLSATGWAHEYLETNTHKEVVEETIELNQKYGARNVLVVLDIDNTLLRSKQPLGSDQWFEWQAEAIKHRSPEAMFTDIDSLLGAQADYFQLSTMALTESGLPQYIQKLKNSGNKMFLLTSRSPTLQNVTERELKRNNLWFSENTLNRGIPFEYQEEPFKAPVSFMSGIFMTAGHHKGEALMHILRKYGSSYKAIIFVDDHERHTRRVYDSLAAANGPEIVTFRYGHEDDKVQAFKSGAKTGVISQSKELARISKQIFGTL